MVKYIICFLFSSSEHFINVLFVKMNANLFSALLANYIIGVLTDKNLTIDPFVTNANNSQPLVIFFIY